MSQGLSDAGLVFPPTCCVATRAFGYWTRRTALSVVSYSASPGFSRSGELKLSEIAPSVRACGCEFKGRTGIIELRSE